MTRKLVGPAALAAVLTVFGADSPARAGVTLSFANPDQTVALPTSGSINVDFVATVTWSNLSQVIELGTGLRMDQGNEFEHGDGLYMDAANSLSQDFAVFGAFVQGIANQGSTFGSGGHFTGTALEFTILPTTQPGLYTYQSDLTTLQNFDVYVQDATTGEKFHTTVNFSITVTGPATAVPEPSTLAGAALGILAAGGVAWRRRKRA